MFTKYFIVVVLLCTSASSDTVDGKSVINSPTTCNSTACNRLCRRLGFRGGACVGNKCDCDNFELSNDLAEPVFKSVDKCYFPDCNGKCMRQGFTGGYCWFNSCKCYNFDFLYQKKSDIISNNEIDAAQSEDSENEIIQGDKQNVNTKTWFPRSYNCVNCNRTYFARWT